MKTTYNTLAIELSTMPGVEPRRLLKACNLVGDTAARIKPCNADNPDGRYWRVWSNTEQNWHSIDLENGTCTCHDALFHPEFACKHRLAAWMTHEYQTRNRKTQKAERIARLIAELYGELSSD